MTERTIRLTESIIIEQSCSKNWRVVESIPWSYFCDKHSRSFSLTESCPGAYQRIDKGETVSLPSKLAETLVERGRAVYPTHSTVVDEGLQATIDKSNVLMDEMGLPRLDPESIRTWTIKGRKADSYYRPRDNRLAQDLGINLEDIDEIRRLAKGS